MNLYTNTRKLALASAVSLAIMSSTGSLAASDHSADIDEARQESRILTTYALSRHLDAHDIEVIVDDTKDVDNQIEVDADSMPATTSGDRSYGILVEDASITAAVKSKLLWSKHAPSCPSMWIRNPAT